MDNAERVSEAVSKGEAVRFTTANGEKHHIDEGGNHFVDTRCINPLKDEDLNIGDTYPSVDNII